MLRIFCELIAYHSLARDLFFYIPALVVEIVLLIVVHTNFSR
jgi:hypothetical protein